MGAAWLLFKSENRLNPKKMVLSNFLCSALECPVSTLILETMNKADNAMEI